MDVKTHKTNYILQEFNKYEPKIQFTMEIGNNSINFLDIITISENGSFVTNGYRKPTWSGRYLNVLFDGYISHKISVINGLVDLAIRLSNQRFHSENWKLVKDVLRKNNYRINFIDKHWNARVNRLDTINDSNNKNSLVNT